MYDYLSKYYNQIFQFNPSINTWIKPFTTVHGHAIDLGCGTGRLTKSIADFDMHVVGIDLDSYMIDMAKTDYPHLEFRVENMLESFNSDQMYDLITCFGNTIVHLDFQSIHDFFIMMKKSLNHGGKIIIQTLNYDQILIDKPQELKPIENQTLKFNRYYTYHDNSITFGTSLYVEGKHFTGSTLIYPYVMHTFKSISEQTGFKLSTYGDLILDIVTPHTNHVYYVFEV
ncbi:MAG: class I SAM-dependent methyltransferase [Acholeplasmataceae bacterium]|jgi:SAM-dependent methyltransferase|nr:class I SAM-dependent methyltransferase [Acholeplasmataceae bacterium]